MTAKTDYIKKGGNSCFKCESDDIEGGSFSTESGVATQSISCNNCDHEWTDIYTLTGVIDDIPEVDSTEKEAIAAAFVESTNDSFEFTLFDEEIGDEITGTVDAKANLGIALSFKGYGDCTSADDSGTPVYIEKYDGRLVVRIYGNINSEDPTHNISLEDARLHLRSPEVEQS